MSDEDLKSYIKSYYLDRKMTYTKLDKHDRAIGVLLEENKQLKKKYENAVADYEYEKYKNNQAIEYIKEDIIGNYFKRYDDEVYKMCDDLLDILGDKENE